LGGWGALLADDWRIRTNVTLSYGLRYETQTISAIMPISRRESGWLGELTPTEKTNHPKTVLRLGYGIFYDRFTSDLVLQQQLQNGVIQQQFLVQKPAFFDPNQAVLPTDPNFQASPATPQTVYQPNPTCVRPTPCRPE